MVIKLVAQDLDLEFRRPSFSFAFYCSSSTRTVCGRNLLLSSLSILSKHRQHRPQHRLHRNQKYLVIPQKIQQKRTSPTRPPIPIAHHCHIGRPPTSLPPNRSSPWASVVSLPNSISTTSGSASNSSSCWAARISSGVGPVKGATLPLTNNGWMRPVQTSSVQVPLRHWAAD